MSFVSLFGICFLLSLRLSPNVSADRILKKDELSFASSYPTPSDFPANLVLDSDPETCAKWFTGDGGLYVLMRCEHVVRAVSITVPEGVYSKDAAQITVYVDSWFGERKKCNFFNGTMGSSTAHFECPGDGLLGKIIGVRDMTMSDNFRVCDIQILVKEKISCLKLPNIHHGTFFYSNDQLTVGTTANATCDDGHRVSGGPLVCSDDGLWTGTSFSCNQIVCHRLPEIEHGQLFYSKNELIPGTTAIVSCSSGYRATGGPLVCGDNDLWTGTSFFCEHIFCRLLPNVPRGYILYSNDQLTVGTSANVSCENGRHATGGPLICDKSGQWSGKNYTCQDILLSKFELEVTLSSPVLSDYPVDLAIDDDPESCTYTKNVSSRWFLVDMGARQNVISVTIIVPKDKYSTDVAQLSVYVYGIPMVKRWMCACFNGTTDSSTLHLTCSGQPLFERFLEVKDERKKNDNFGLCDIQILVK